VTAITPLEAKDITDVFEPVLEYFVREASLSSPCAPPDPLWAKNNPPLYITTGSYECNNAPGEARDVNI
jgi:hypothetical protein